MTNNEILLWIMRLNPENEQQAIAIKNMENAFRRHIGDVDSSDYELSNWLDLYDEGFFLNVPTAIVYQDYKNYCDKCKIKCCSLKLFSRYVNAKYGIKTKPVRIDGKLIRIFSD